MLIQTIFKLITIPTVRNPAMPASTQRCRLSLEVTLDSVLALRQVVYTKAKRSLQNSLGSTITLTMRMKTVMNFKMSVWMTLFVTANSSPPIITLIMQQVRAKSALAANLAGSS